MTISLMFLFIFLCGYSFTLDGFDKAFSFIFTPDFSKFKPSGVIEALGLSFFTLSLGQGIMLTYVAICAATKTSPALAALLQ